MNGGITCLKCYSIIEAYLKKETNWHTQDVLKKILKEIKGE